jgi:hypothetical protein
MLEKWSIIDSIPNTVCSFLNKLYVVFLTLISGELVLLTSADCKNLTLQQPCRSWEDCSSCEMFPVLTWGHGQGMWTGPCGHRGLTYDSIFGLAHHQLFA